MKSDKKYITKSTIKEKYLFSEGWIKKLGEPDKSRPNPHGCWTKVEIKTFP